MTFLELCKATRQECGIQGSSVPVAVDGQVGILKRVIDWVADADLYIQRMHTDWNFLWTEYSESSIPGSMYLPLPSRNTVGVWDDGSFAVDRGTSDGRPLGLINFREWRNFQSEKQAAAPTRICIMPNKTLALEFPADDAYQIYANYWKTPTKLESNTDIPPYSHQYHRAIICKAKMFFFEDSEAISLYQVAEKEFNEIISQLEAEYLPNQYQLNQMSPEPIVVVPS